ncbi:MAG: dTMP kinase [Chloroflexi bacterium]|nr:dTMP kinase [Chloroflexota bacterium]MBT7081456.1 dTMP kinase [Chloroflexota bacterium]MBT7290298.1 dTMP kinase [Chloroflexota bacterium]
MSLFIVFEGGDGSGKTVQSKALSERLKKTGKYQVLHTQEPGDTLFGQLLRRVLRHPDLGQPVLKENFPQLMMLEPSLADHALPDVILQTSAPRAELLFFVLARAQIIDEVIQPHLSKNTGAIVICDRYIYSTVAYQGYGRDMDVELINQANKIATRGIQPDLVVLLDIEPEEGLKRKRADSHKDHFDDKEVSFHKRIRKGYLAQADQDPGRWLVVDATKSKKEIEQIIWDRVSGLLPKTD